MDDLNDHPDLRDLRLSKRDERKARAEARRRQRQAFGMPPEPSFLRRHRTVLVSVAGLAALVVAAVLLVDDLRPGASPVGMEMDQRPEVDLSQPFTATPAAGWADGEAGIVPPRAAPVGTYTAEQVAAAYQQVRQAMITARLDPAVLEGHDHEPYLALLAPSARASVTPDLAPPSMASYALVTRIADGYHLLPVAPKVTGEMWAEEGPGGALLVHTNFVFAYAFAPVDPEVVQRPMDIVTVNRFEADYTVTDARWPEPDRGLWPGTVRNYGYSIACEAYRRGEMAPGYSEKHFTSIEDDALAEASAFDLERPLPTLSTCPE